MSLLLGLLLFGASWILLYLLYRKFRPLWERSGFLIYPLFLMWRRRSREQWAPHFSRTRGFRVYEWTSLALTAGSMALGVYLIISIAISTLSPSPTTSARLQPLIPGVTVSLSQVPYLLASIGLSVTVHELMHALSSTSQGISVRRIGVILLGVFPGAFVEPDQSQFSALSILSKLKVISAGIAVNAIIAGVSYALLPLLVTSFSHGVLIVGVLPNSPAQLAGLKEGDVVIGVNGTPIQVPAQLGHFTSQDSPLILNVLDHGVQRLIQVTPKMGRIGVYVDYYFTSPLSSGILNFLDWNFLVNFSLAVFNGAPLIITDGGKFLTEVMKKLGPKGETISYSIQAFLVLLFILALSI
jgi:membrane-associated protease RseP (regulator of RpoE activity)